MRRLDALRADAGVLLSLLRGMPRSATHEERLQAFYAPQAAHYDAFRERLLQGRRESTVVAPQALFLMNSQVVREQAAAFAERLLSHSDGADADADVLAQRVALAHEIAFGRPPTREETSDARQFFASAPPASSEAFLPSSLST